MYLTTLTFLTALALGLTAIAYFRGDYYILVLSGGVFLLAGVFLATSGTLVIPDGKIVQSNVSSTEFRVADDTFVNTSADELHRTIYADIDTGYENRILQPTSALSILYLLAGIFFIFAGVSKPAFW